MHITLSGCWCHVTCCPICQHFPSSILCIFILLNRILSVSKCAGTATASWTTESLYHWSTWQSAGWYFSKAWTFHTIHHKYNLPFILLILVWVINHGSFTETELRTIFSFNSFHLHDVPCNGYHSTLMSLPPLSEDVSPFT